MYSLSRLRRFSQVSPSSRWEHQNKAANPLREEIDGETTHQRRQALRTAFSEACIDSIDKGPSRMGGSFILVLPPRGRRNLGKPPQPGKGIHNSTPGSATMVYGRTSKIRGAGRGKPRPGEVSDGSTRRIHRNNEHDEGSKPRPIRKRSKQRKRQETLLFSGRNEQ